MRKLTIKNFDNKGEETYATVVVNILKQPKDAEKGASYDEMSHIVPILTKFESVGPLEDGQEKEILLEEAEWELVCERIEIAPFQQNTKQVYTMIKSIVEAPKVEVHLAAGGE